MACGCERAKCSLEPGDKRHGTLSGYTDRKCGCDACRKANRERQKAYYAANGEAVRQREKARYEARREAILERVKAYEAANREVILERKKAHRDANREAYRERDKAYRAANREAGLERSKAYYAANREAGLERSKAYRAANPDMYRAYKARRRARKKGATIGPAFTRQQVWDRDSGICHICNLPADPGDWHLEHVIPLKRGGAHSFENCAVSHPTCNLRKGARLLDELAAECTMSTVSH